MRFKARSTFAIAAAVALVLSSAGLAAASEVDVAVVDITAPTNTVTVAAGGGSEPITINASVTGQQVGTATFEVYRDWTLKDGAFVGSNAQEFTVGPRAGGDPATTFSTSGVVTVDRTQEPGDFTVQVRVFDITNTNTTGAKLAAGADGSYTVKVTAPTTPTNTPPTVEVVGFTDGQTFEIGTTPTPSCSVSDAEDSNETATPDVSVVSGPLAAYGLGEVTVTCSYTDGQGLSDRDSKGYTIVDTGAPVITDLGPTALPDGSNGWYINSVTNQFRATDSGAGFVTTTPKQLTKDFSLSSGTTEGSAVKISSGSVSDVAGNASGSTDSGTFKIDLTAPTVTCDASVPFKLGSSGTVSATVADTVSGPEQQSVSVAVDTTTIGTKSAMLTGKDTAGHTTSTWCSYSVVYDFTGFFKPVNNDGANIVKAGSAVPIKFSLGGDQGLSVIAAGFPKSQVGDYVDPGDSATVLETVTAGSSSLQYDASTGTYIYVWKTDKAWANSERQFVMKLADGSLHTLNFSFTR